MAAFGCPPRLEAEKKECRAAAGQNLIETASPFLSNCYVKWQKALCHAEFFYGAMIADSKRNARLADGITDRVLEMKQRADAEYRICVDYATRAGVAKPNP
jgi:hypothetical protein